VFHVSELFSRQDSENFAHYELVIHERRQVMRVRLPASGSVVIGRSGDCDVRLDDGSVSRQHAKLHVGAVPELEDLGSRNGSRVFNGVTTFENIAEGVAGEGARLTKGQRAKVGPGQAFRVGKVICFLQKTAPLRRTDPVPADEGVPCEEIVLQAPATVEAFELASRFAPTNLPVLILGETGVGKDVLADHVHRSSPRHRGPFVRVNCGALSETLLESELFGHQRGAFTGAVDSKPGLLELGDGGSVFLDEIGELPPATQVKLLHALETGEVTRVGSTRSKRVDVRFIAATNRDLGTDVQQGRFRKDLYFRINGGRIVIAPLRERQADIEPLARLFLSRFCSKNVIPVPEISSAAIRRFHEYAWPGNARELKNAMERAALMSAGEIEPRHLPKEEELTKSVDPAEDEITRWDAPTTVGRPAGPAAEGAHWNIVEALQICAGNQTRAAKLLGISRRTLVNRLNEYSLPRPRKRSV
jgi:transcriptional regulator with PAS, ATPase and Fis domain